MAKYLNLDGLETLWAKIKSCISGKQDTVSTDTDLSGFDADTKIVTGFGSNKLYLNTAARLWTYIQNQISSVLGLSPISYGGNAATATTATNYASGGGIADALAAKSPTTHTHSVKINGVTKTIPATGDTAVDLGTYLTSHQDISGKADKADITGATKCKITYNSQGIVTAGADLSASDIPNLAASKITSGTFGTDRIADNAITAAKVKDNETLPVNVSGNAATATKATQDADGNNIKTTYMKASSGNKSLSYGGTTTIGTVNGSNVNLVMPAANADTYEVEANSTSFSDALAAFNDNKKLLLKVGKSGGGAYNGLYYLPLYRLTFRGNTITQFVWLLDGDAYGDDSGSNTYGAIYLYKLSESGWDNSSDNVEYAKAAGTAYGGTADYLKILHTNEVNFKNVPKSGNKGRLWFNFRNGDTDASDSNNPLTDYYFGNRNMGTSTTLHANRLAGSADKWKGWSIVVGSTGTDANTLYFV